MLSDELKFFATQSLGRYISSSHHSLVRLLARQLQATNVDLTAEQCRVLFVLFFMDGIMQQEIGRVLLQEKSSVSRLVHALESKGYVRRVQGAHDERQKHVYLTSAGWAMQEMCLQCVQNVQNPVRERFIAAASYEEWQQLMVLLQKLSHVLGESTQ